jgi:hypothetical protein
MSDQGQDDTDTFLFKDWCTALHENFLDNPPSNAEKKTLAFFFASIFVQTSKENELVTQISQEQSAETIKEYFKEKKNNNDESDNLQKWLYDLFKKLGYTIVQEEFDNLYEETVVNIITTWFNDECEYKIEDYCYQFLVEMKTQNEAPMALDDETYLGIIFDGVFASDLGVDVHEYLQDENSQIAKCVPWFETETDTTQDANGVEKNTTKTALKFWKKTTYITKDNALMSKNAIYITMQKLQKAKQAKQAIQKKSSVIEMLDIMKTGLFIPRKYWKSAQDKKKMDDYIALELNEETEELLTKHEFDKKKTLNLEISNKLIANNANFVYKEANAFFFKWNDIIYHSYNFLVYDEDIINLVSAAKQSDESKQKYYEMMLHEIHDKRNQYERILKKDSLYQTVKKLQQNLKSVSDELQKKITTILENCQPKQNAVPTQKLPRAQKSSKKDIILTLVCEEWHRMCDSNFAADDFVQEFMKTYYQRKNQTKDTQPPANESVLESIRFKSSAGLFTCF